MENERVYTEKDFPIQARILLTWIPFMIIAFSVLVIDDRDPIQEPLFWAYIHSRMDSLIAMIAVIIIIGIFFWKRKGFLVGGEGIRMNPRFLGGTTGHLVYGRIASVYVRQQFSDRLLGIASVCIELKTISPAMLQNFPPRRVSPVCISGLLLRDAEELCQVIEKRANNLIAEDIIRAEKSIIESTNGAYWLGAICLTLFTPWTALYFGLEFSSDAKNIFFWFFPPLLTFLSFKYWRRFFSKEPKSPQLAYLTVYSTALLLVILVMSAI